MKLLVKINSSLNSLKRNFTGKELHSILISSSLQNLKNENARVLQILEEVATNREEIQTILSSALECKEFVGN